MGAEGEGSVGETAPVLYTAGWSDFLWKGHLIKEPIGYPTYVIWAFVTEPFASAHALAYAAALFVTRRAGVVDANNTSSSQSAQRGSDSPPGTATLF